MQNLPQNVSLIGVAGGDSQRVASELAEGRIAVQRRDSLEQWGDAAPLSNGHAPSGGSATVVDDCLVLVAPAAAADALAAIEQASRQQAGIPIVLVVHSATRTDAVAAMRRGAYDVVDQADGQAALHEAVHAALAEGRRTAPRRRLRADLAQRLTLLAPAERQVLDAMLDGMANKQIAQHLQIGLRTVELRRSKIMKKMQARNLAELVKFICQAAPSVYLEPQAASPLPEELAG